MSKVTVSVIVRDFIENTHKGSIDEIDVREKFTDFFIYL